MIYAALHFAQICQCVHAPAHFCFLKDHQDLESTFILRSSGEKQSWFQEKNFCYFEITTAKKKKKPLAFWILEDLSSPCLRCPSYWFVFVWRSSLIFRCELLFLIGVWSRAACSQGPAVPVRWDEGDVTTERGITEGNHFLSIIKDY